jgi:hypothetical protein
MIDLSDSVIPKSDQTNSDDLLAGPITIEVNKVTLNASEQPVSVHYVGGEGRPFKPCKSMRRVLILAWGADGEKYIGRSMTLYSDPSVKWAGQEIGGIRISHMSNIDSDLRFMLTVSRGKRDAYRVKPLIVNAGTPMTDEEFDILSGDIQSAEEIIDLQKIGLAIKAGGYDDAGNKRIKKVFSARMKVVRADV